MHSAACRAKGAGRAPEQRVHLQRGRVIGDGGAVAVGQLVNAAQQEEARGAVGHLCGGEGCQGWVWARGRRAIVSVSVADLWAPKRQPSPPTPHPPHPRGIVVGHQRRLRLCELAQLHGAQRTEVAALFAGQPPQQVVGAVRLVASVVAGGQQEQVGLRGA